jgi:hypothetical protein
MMGGIGGKLGWKFLETLEILYMEILGKNGESRIWKRWNGLEKLGNPGFDIFG